MSHTTARILERIQILYSLIRDTISYVASDVEMGFSQDKILRSQRSGKRKLHSDIYSTINLLLFNGFLRYVGGNYLGNIYV